MRRITAPWPSLHTQKKYMSEKRQWDESRSPQWRYLLSKDSKEKREREKREERMERAEGELKKGVSKRKKRKAQESRHQENRKLKSKSGREILYSASPGGENSSYRNTEFVSRKKTTEIFTNTDNDETQ